MTMLSDSLMLLISYARLLAQNPSGDATEVALRLDTLIEAARDNAARAGTAKADVDDALFAVCAWIDEALLNSGWESADQWTLRLLQKRYFDTSHAGIEFFERIERLDRTRANVLEIYLLCLQFGFSGRYGYGGDRQSLEEVRQRALDLLSSEAGATEGGEPLFPDAYACADPSDETARAKARRRHIARTGMSFGLPLAILLMLYLIYHIVIWQMVDSVLPQLL